MPLTSVVMLRRRGAAVLLDVGPDAPLPTEFRVFHAGVNTTTQGDLVFDDVAAASVMVAYTRHGVRGMIDLQHDSVDPAACAARNDAADARAYYALEVRRDADGGPELWAVDVAWTPDGARRLREGTQRYISPVAFYNRETLRVTDLFNLALVSAPAIDYAPPLIAARRLGKTPMDPKLIQEALDALIAGDAAKCAELLKRLVADAAGATTESEAPADGAGVEAAAEPADPKPEPGADAAMARALRSVLKVASPADVVASVKRLQADVAALQLSRDADDANERIDLVGELVKLGVEIPATAWADPEKRIPSDVLRAMAMPALRARVAAFRAAPRAAAVAAPKGAASLGAAALSDSDRARAEQIADPSARARFVAARLSRMTKGV